MNGKKMMIFGDSYSTYEGYIPKGYAVYYNGHRGAEPDVFNVNNTWWMMLANRLGLEIVENNSWSGSTVGYTGYGGNDCSHSSSFIYRFETRLKEGFFEKNEIDILFVLGGTNDSWADAPLGEVKFDGITDADLYQVLPALCHIAKRLKDELPKTRVIFIANCDIKEEIINATRTACEHYGHGFIALTGIDKLNGHPTELGMKQIFEQVLDYLK
ncbi:MAG: hypothetical protein IJF38_00645 [Clostridia bacterium]|nr:hypothetical protein [Clostridia bacterium]